MDRLEQNCAYSVVEGEPADMPRADAYYRGVFWAAADPFLVADAAGRYLDANHAAAMLLGYSREELLRMHVADIVAADVTWTVAEYDRFLHSGNWFGELELRRRDNTLVPVEAHATVVQGQDGEAVYLSVLRDISSRRAAARAQRDFLAMVAHELKTPLTAILGHAQLMQRRAAYNGLGTEAIVAQARRLKRLIDDLGEAVHFAAGQPELLRSSVDLAALAQEVAAHATMAMPTHKVQIAVSEQPLIGWWDADRVAQVLHNLLANAGKYSPAGSAIRIQLEARTDEALVAVSDQGSGVSSDELPRLFEPFYRTASAIRSGAEGLGLGLHICKVLVEAHGGRIWVQSAPGLGTTVSFTLPRTQAPSG